MGLVVGGLLGATAGAALAAYVQKRRASEPRDENEFRRRLAELEAEIEDLEFKQRGRRDRLERASGAAVSGSYRRPRLQTKPHRLRFEPRNDGHL